MTRRVATHERFSTDQVVEPSSERSFGIVFAAVFAVVAILPALQGRSVRFWALILASALLAVTFMRPRLLAPLNRWWARFGVILSRIVSPVVMAFIFYGVVTPIGVLLRLAGKDLLNLRWDRDTETYWIARQPPGPAPETMRQQF